MRWSDVLLRLLPGAVAWWAAALAVIRHDQKERAERARPAQPTGTYDSWPWLRLALICGGLSLPVYFTMTRKTVGGALTELGWLVVATLLATGAQVAFTLIAREITSAM